MNFGFVRVAAISPPLRVADCRYNTQQTIAAMGEAAAQGVRVALFPELGITGYSCGDLFGQQALLEGALDGLMEIARASQSLGMMAIVGLPLRHEQKLYNCAAAVCGGRVLGVIPKRDLPNYDEFYEGRYFTAAPAVNQTIDLDGQAVPFGPKLLFACAELPELVVAAEICADLWGPLPPSSTHALAGATVIGNLSASNELVGKADNRRKLIVCQSSQLICGYLYAGASEDESTSDLVFSGHCLIAESGTLLAESALFTRGMIVTDLDVERLVAERQHITTFASRRSDDYRRIPFSLPLGGQEQFSRVIPMSPFMPDDQAQRESWLRTTLQIQTTGLRRRLEHTRCQTAVIGVSGGLDSTLALLVAVGAMDAMARPRTDVLAVTMPSFGTTSRTRTNAEKLCEALGVTLRTVDITAAVTQHFADIGQPEDRFDVTYENSQARERTQVLMDLANRVNGLVVGTGDLSELALGWTTYNGDHMSMYGVNASVPKTMMRHVVGYVADTTDDQALRAVLLDVLDTPVSPELLPAHQGEIAQKTEDLVGPYELHDFFLYYFLRFGFAPEKILWMATRAFGQRYAEDVIRKWLDTFLQRFFTQQFKRSCLPDGPKVGPVSLSPRGDWRMPSDIFSTLWRQRL